MCCVDAEERRGVAARKARREQRRQGEGGGELEALCVLMLCSFLK